MVWGAVWCVSASAGPLQLGPPRYADDVDLVTEVGTVRIDEGFVFSVLDERHDAPAGYVVVGSGTVAFSFARASEALALVEPLVAARQLDATAAAQAVTRAAWSEAFDVAVVFGEVPAAIDALPAVLDARDDVVYLDTDPREVVVQTWRLGKARDVASRALSDRAERLAAVGIDPVVALDQGRLQATRRWVAELHTPRTWRSLIAPANRAQDEWLTWFHDPSGTVDDLYASGVLVHGVLDRSDLDPAPRVRVLTGVPHGPPAGGVRIERASVNAVVAPGGIAHRVDFEAELVIATDVETRLVTLAVPVAEPTWRVGQAATRSFAIRSVETADGRPLEAMGSVYGPWRPGGAWSVDTWVLPVALPAGGQTAIRVMWTDRWNASQVLDVSEWLLEELVRAGVCPNAIECTCIVNEPTDPDVAWKGRIPDSADLGGGVVGQAVVPVVPGRSTAFPAEIRVGTTLGRAWQAAVDGVVTERTGDGGRWWVGQTTSAGRVSFGPWREDRVSALAGFPAVRVLHHDAMAVRPELVRSVIQFFRAALPAYPGPTFTVVQGPAAPRADPMTIERFPCRMNKAALAALRPERRALTVPLGEVPAQRDAPWIARSIDQMSIHGIAAIGNDVGGVERTVRAEYPHQVERSVAEALAARWWDGVGAGRRDAWIAPAAAAVYRDAFVREAFPDASARWDAVVAADLARAIGHSVAVPLSTQLEPFSGELGARILRALGQRTGEVALLRGLDAFRRSGDGTTDGLARALREASGVDVGAWFDAWVHAGVRPAVVATWAPARHGLEDTVVMRVEADTAATLEVPVRVSTPAESRVHWVAVRDGVGTASLTTFGPAHRVEVDPDGWLPLRQRDAVRVTDEVEGGDRLAPELPDGYAVYDTTARPSPAARP